jgi:hypothetical protein
MEFKEYRKIVRKYTEIVWTENNKREIYNYFGIEFGNMNLQLTLRNICIYSKVKETRLEEEYERELQGIVKKLGHWKTIGLLNLTLEMANIVARKENCEVKKTNIYIAVLGKLEKILSIEEV